MPRFSVASGGRQGSYQAGEVPFVGQGVVAQNEGPPVVDLYFEVPMSGMEPPIEELNDVEAALAEPEGARFLLAPVAGVAFYADGHEFSET